MSSTAKFMGVVLLFVFAATVNAGIIFNDGLSHDINSEFDHDIQVMDSVSGKGTSLNIHTGSARIGEVDVFGTSEVTFYGGQVIGRISGFDNAVFTVYGTDFQINSSPASYGAYFDVVPNDYTHYLVTGKTLAGEAISYDFFLNADSELILIPEPATMLMLGLGSLLLRKRIS